MTFRLPPSNQPPSKNERFYQFLARNAGQHGMPVLPSAFDDFVFYWTWHENRPGHAQPFTLNMETLAQKALENPMLAGSAQDFAFRAAALSQGTQAVICYDTPNALKSDSDSGAWLEKISLKELIFQCAGNGLGAVFFSNKRMFQLSPGSIFKLTGIQIPSQEGKDIGLAEDNEFGPSGLSQERQDLFREMIARNDDWIVQESVEFVTCKAGDGNTYEGVTFQVKPGTPDSKVVRESGAIGRAVTLITNEQFAVIPQRSQEPPFTHER